MSHQLAQRFGIQPVFVGVAGVAEPFGHRLAAVRGRSLPVPEMNGRLFPCVILQAQLAIQKELFIIIEEHI